MKKIVLLLFLILAVAFIALRTKNQSAEVNQASPTPEATTMPFAEMTIPFLRGREYKSTLAELTRYQDKPNYTSFLTSYTSDGLKVNGLLTIPKGEQNTKWPAIVFVHGYIAPTLYKTTERYVDYVDYLARNGFVVFKIDLRGNGNSEGDPSGAYYSSDYVIDTLNALSALQNASFVNRSEVGLWGHSMAGNVVMRAFAVKPDIPAVVIWAGAGYTYTDLQTYRISDRSYHPPSQTSEVTRKRDELNKTYGTFAATSPFWSQVAVTNYLKDLKGALEINHAVDDPVVSIEYSRNLMKLLDSTSMVHVLNEFPGGGHNISGANFAPAMQKTVDFYKKYLVANP